MVVDDEDDESFGQPFFMSVLLELVSDELSVLVSLELSVEVLVSAAVSAAVVSVDVSAAVVASVVVAADVSAASIAALVLLLSVAALAWLDINVPAPAPATPIIASAPGTISSLFRVICMLLSLTPAPRGRVPLSCHFQLNHP